MDKLAVARKKLIVALDVSTAQEAEKLVKKLATRVGMFKIGKQLFTSQGPSIVRRVKKLGGKVFLDLKYHDIPNTVKEASLEAASLGVSMFNMHCSGGRRMMTEARAGIDTLDKKKRPIILGVTILTSHNYDDFVDMEFFPQIGDDKERKEKYLRDRVVRLAKIAKECTLDGVVASPLEAADIRKECGPRFLIVTPGIRPLSAQHNDQERVMTPGEAIRVGIDFVVVGRPVYGAPDPVRAADDIIEEMAAAL